MESQIKDYKDKIEECEAEIVEQLEILKEEQLKSRQAGALIPKEILQQQLDDLKEKLGRLYKKQDELKAAGPQRNQIQIQIDELEKEKKTIYDKWQIIHES